MIENVVKIWRLADLKFKFQWKLSSCRVCSYNYRLSYTVCPIYSKFRFHPLKFMHVFFTSFSGSNPGKWGNCVFPFQYKGKVYTTCISYSHDRPWCSRTFNYDADKFWDNCPTEGSWGYRMTNCKWLWKETHDLILLLYIPETIILSLTECVWDFQNNA